MRLQADVSLYFDAVQTADISSAFEAALVQTEFIWGLQESDEWAEDQTNKASLDPSIKVARERGDPGTKGQTGDLHVSAALRNLLRTSLRQEESSLQTSEFV